MTTQPAGEHHTGTQDASPISDELADAVLAVKERGVPCPPNCDYQTHRRAEVRAELEAAYPAIRQQVAEEIAATLERSGEAMDSLIWLSVAGRRAAKIAREIGGTA